MSCLQSIDLIQLPFVCTLWAEVHTFRHHKGKNNLFPRLRSPFHRIKSREELHAEQRSGSWQLLPNQASLCWWSPARLRSHRHGKPQAFSTAATFRLELWGWDVFESYSLPCHRNGGKKIKINQWNIGRRSNGRVCGGLRGFIPAPPCCFHIRLCRAQEQMQLCFTELSGCLSIALQIWALFLTLWLFTFVYLYFTVSRSASNELSSSRFLTLAYFLSFFFFFSFRVKPSLKLISVPAKQRHPNFHSIFLAEVPSSLCGRPLIDSKHSGT